MKEIKNILIVTTFLIVVIVTQIAVYYIFSDIESKETSKETFSEECQIQTKIYQGRKIFTISPNNKNNTEKVILYFHGGSYVAEMTKEHWDFLGRLANDTGLQIIVPDYPLTPKYNYEDVFNMVEPLYNEIIKNINAHNLIMMGDSAGGGLALALEEKLGVDNIECPEKLILISPWLDVRMENNEINKIEKYDTDLSKEKLKLAGIAYSGIDGINNYLVNPIEGPLKNLKNVTIFTGTYDILNPDVHKLINKAQNEGITIQIKEYSEAKHIWIINSPNEEVSKNAYNDLLETLNY